MVTPSGEGIYVAFFIFIFSFPLPLTVSLSLTHPRSTTTLCCTNTAWKTRGGMTSDDNEFWFESHPKAAPAASKTRQYEPSCYHNRSCQQVRVLHCTLFLLTKCSFLCFKTKLNLISLLLCARILNPETRVNINAVTCVWPAPIGGKRWHKKIYHTDNSHHISLVCYHNQYKQNSLIYHKTTKP